MFYRAGNWHLLAEKVGDSHMIYFFPKHFFSGRQFVSVLRSVCFTQLGNQLSAYATLFYFKRKYGFNAFIAPYQAKKIGVVMEPDLMEIKPLHFVTPSCQNPRCSDGCQVPAWQSVSRHHHGENYKDLMENSEKYMHNKLLDLGNHTVPLYLFKGKSQFFSSSFIDFQLVLFICYLVCYLKYLKSNKKQIGSNSTEIFPELKREFKFRDYFILKANEIFSFLTNMTNDNMIFVGVHARRGDHLLSWREKFPDSEIGKFEGKYFNHAMNMFRIKYNKNNTTVIFVATSDDFDWIKENFVNPGDIFFIKDLVTVPTQWVKMHKINII